MARIDVKPPTVRKRLWMVLGVVGGIVVLMLLGWGIDTAMVSSREHTYDSLAASLRGSQPGKSSLLSKGGGSGAHSEGSTCPNCSIGLLISSTFTFLLISPSPLWQYQPSSSFRPLLDAIQTR